MIEDVDKTFPRPTKGELWAFYTVAVALLALAILWGVS